MESSRIIKMAVEGPVILLPSIMNKSLADSIVSTAGSRGSAVFEKAFAWELTA
jgi:hypothetical protein